MSRKHAERQRLNQIQWTADLQWLMNDQRGRRIIKNLCERAGIEQSPMTGNSQTFHNIGRQEFMRDVMRELRIVALSNVRVMEDEAIAHDAINRQLPDEVPEA